MSLGNLQYLQRKSILVSVQGRSLAHKNEGQPSLQKKENKDISWVIRVTSVLQRSDQTAYKCREANNF